MSHRGSRDSTQSEPEASKVGMNEMLVRKPLELKKSVK